MVHVGEFSGFTVNVLRFRIFFCAGFQGSGWDSKVFRDSCFCGLGFALGFDVVGLRLVGLWVCFRV